MTNELLSNEQLDGVTGGTKQEINKDYLLMCDLNEGGNIRFSGDMNTMKEMQRVWAKLGFSVIFHKDADTPNEYYNSRGEQISRSEAIDSVLKMVGNKKLDRRYYL